MILFALRSAFVFIFSFLITVYLIPIFERVAFRLNVVDAPDGKLKKHLRVVPYLGGVAVYLGF